MVRALRELGASFDGAAVRVLCYHSGLDRRRFATQMAVIADEGYSVLSLEQFRDGSAAP